MIGMEGNRRRRTRNAKLRRIIDGTLNALPAQLALIDRGLDDAQSPPAFAALPRRFPRHGLPAAR